MMIQVWVMMLDKKKHHKSGISLSSTLEQKYSPNNTIIINAKTLITHQSQVAGNPPYIQQIRKWMIKRVIEKSRHFLDFSTTSASSTAPATEERIIAQLSNHPSFVQSSMYFAVKIRSTVILDPVKKWMIWKRTDWTK